MPSFPTIDLSKIDLSKFDLSKFDLSKLELPTFDVPTFDLPTFDLPKVDLPDVDLPSAEQVLGFARDAAYVGVGLAVLTVERLVEWQQQLTELLTSQIDKARQAA